MMQSRISWKSGFCVLLAVGVILPGSVLSASGASRIKSVRTSQSGKLAGRTSAIQDVSLNADGSFSGAIVDGMGNPVSRSKVVLKHGHDIIAEATTDDAGRFHLKQLRGGVYKVSHTQGSAMSRVWSNGTAPKSTNRDGRLMTGQSESRDRDLLSRLDHSNKDDKPKKPKKPKHCKPNHGHSTGIYDRLCATPN
jgi:hypothetical protein